MRALITEPAILFMDEPFANLDPTLKPGMATLLKKIRTSRGLTMMFVTHDICGAASLADSVVAIRRGYGYPSYREWKASEASPGTVEGWMSSVKGEG